MSTLASLPFLLYEDSRCFVLDKPAGLHSVGLAGEGSENLAAMLAQIDKALMSASEKPEDAGLAQRLDRDTSGVILGAKDRAAWKELRSAIQAGQLEKSYLIVAEGKFPLEAVADTFIGSPNRGARKVRIYRDAPAKSQRALPAHTSFERIAYDEARDISLVRAFAPTARRHQVRAHAAFLKHPLLGDALYGSRRTTREALPKIEGLPAFLLHAEALTFRSPDDKRERRITAPIPNALRSLFSPQLSRLAG